MANVRIDEIDGLDVAAVTHAKLSTIPASATVAEARAYFAASTSRRLAFVVDDDGRYVGSLTPNDLPVERSAEDPVMPLARVGPTVGSGEPATIGRDLALASDSLRVPVIDGADRLLGVVAVNRTREWFCGTG
ncbi:MAG TPA: CBS domain-containing protein [Solirubrobacteraceae bacterium]|jgi:Mg/Co/Ni transporter MgtE